MIESRTAFCDLTKNPKNTRSAEYRYINVIKQKKIVKWLILELHFVIKRENRLKNVHDHEVKPKKSLHLESRLHTISTAPEIRYVHKKTRLQKLTYFNTYSKLKSYDKKLDLKKCQGLKSNSCEPQKINSKSKEP